MGHKVRKKDLDRLLGVLGVFDGHKIGTCVIVKNSVSFLITADLNAAIKRLRSYTGEDIYPQHILSWQCVCGEVHSDGNLFCTCNRQED